MGSFLPGTETLAWGPDVGWDSSLLRYPSWICIYHTWKWDLLPTSLDGCVFFNSVPVRLPFNSIFAGSEWWLIYNLVAVFMWLCKEVSCVYLCGHFNQFILFIYGHSQQRVYFSCYSFCFECCLTNSWKTPHNRVMNARKTSYGIDDFKGTFWI